jgi:hypothetical protein
MESLRQRFHKRRRLEEDMEKKLLRVEEKAAGLRQTVMTAKEVSLFVGARATPSLNSFLVIPFHTYTTDTTTRCISRTITSSIVGIACCKNRRGSGRQCKRYK